MGVRDDLAGRRVGEFILRERIGEGGFGAVYRCEQPLLGREAVVKVLHGRLRASDAMVQRFLREAQLASRLDHPYAAHVYAFGVEREDGLPWIAMEMVHGTPLDRWLTERGPLAVADLVPFVERMAEVVQTAHERGIVHRDLKPSNVMVIERAGRLLPKLLDFGIATLVADVPALVELPMRSPATTESSQITSASELQTLTASNANVPGLAIDARLTATGAALGSPPYMAPEQWTRGSVGPPADLYALGVLVYEALTGRRPFTASTTAELAELHTTAPVPPVAAPLAPVFDGFFARALAKAPGDRPGSALELAATLRIAAGLGEEPVELPRLDRGIHDVWVADAPQPLADAVAMLDAARNVHQARDSARELLRALIRYLLAVALAGRAQVRHDAGDPTLLGLLRALRQRDLDDDERIRLLRELVRPFVDRPATHPVPPLVELCSTRDALGSAARHATACDALTLGDDALRSRLVSFIAELARLLRAASFVLDHQLVIVRGGRCERWAGLRRPRRGVVAVRGAAPPEDQPALLARDGQVALLLAPLVQAIAGPAGAEAELFVLDGCDRRGARLVATPSGFVHHDPAIWDWLGDTVIGSLDGAAPTRAADQTPYLGLAAFATSDADRFVGRERETDALLNRLRIGALQVVVGASGAGKSSFVYAGVVPALPPGTCVIAMRPGASPLATLTSRLPPASENQPVVVIVDQLEELFTMCADDRERERFAARLAELSSSPDGTTRVICTVRDDFLMRVEALAPLGRRLSAAVFLLGNPSREDLVRTVVEPARRHGYELSDAELAGEMADAVAGRPGALAVLSFTAARLWELRDRRFHQLTRRAYDGMGGVAGALGRHAEETLLALQAEDQELVRLAFRRLVTAEGTRAQVSTAELEQVLASDRASLVIGKLVDARLVVIVDGDRGPQIELAHEALLAAWPRAQTWLREDADGARLRDQLVAAARQWEARGHVRGVLWRDDALADLERWLRRSDAAALTSLEREFVAASRVAASRSRRTRRLIAGGAFATLASALAVSLYFSAEATTQRERAEDTAEASVAAAAETRARLAEQTEEQGRLALLAGKSGRALLYFATALDRGAPPTPSLHLMIDEAMRPFDAARAVMRGHGKPVQSLVLLAPGRVLSSGEDGTARVLDLAAGRELRVLHAPVPLGDARIDATGSVIAGAGRDGLTRLYAIDGEQTRELRVPLGQIRNYYYPAFSPDGARILTVHGEERVARVWSTRSGTLQLTIPIGDKAPVFYGKRAAWNPRGDTFATSSPAELRDARTGVLRAHLPHGDSITGLAFSPDGSRLATASFDQTAALWDGHTGARQARLEGHAAPVEKVAFDPSGTYVVTGSRDETARVWLASTGQLHAILDGLGAAVTALAFDGGGRLAIGAEDGTIHLWTLRSGRPLGRLEGHAGAVTALVFDGPTLVSGGSDGSVRTWSLDELGVDVIEAPCRTPGALELSPDDRRVAVGCVDGTAEILPLDHGPATELPKASTEISALAFVTSEQIATLSRDGALRVLAAGRSATTVVPRGVTAIELGPDRRTLLAGTDAGEVVHWNTATWRPTATWKVDGAVAGMHFARAGDRAVVQTERELVVYRVSDGRRESSMSSAGVTGDALVADRLLVAATGTQLQLWEASGVRIEPALAGHAAAIFSLGLDALGRRAVSASRDGTLAVWDLQNRSRIGTLEGHAGRAVDARFDTRGFIYSVGIDRTLRVWDPDALRAIASHRAHRGTVFQLRISRGGEIAVATDSESGIVVHHVDARERPVVALRAVVGCLPFELVKGRIVPRPRPATCR